MMDLAVFKESSPEKEEDEEHSNFGTIFTNPNGTFRIFSGFTPLPALPTSHDPIKSPNKILVEVDKTDGGRESDLTPPAAADAATAAATTRKKDN